MLPHGRARRNLQFVLHLGNKKPAKRFRVLRALKSNRAECYLTLIKMMAKVYSAIDSISTSARISMF